MRLLASTHRFPWLAALLVACGGDDGSAASDGSSSEGSTTTAASATLGTTLDTTADTTADTGITATSPDSTAGSTDTTASDGSTGPSNNPPVPDADVFYTTQDLALATDAETGVLANDVDEDGDALTVSDADALSEHGGTVVVAADGALDYTPAPGFWGPDSFGYTVSDGVDEAAGVVTIYVAPIVIPLFDVTAGIGGFTINGELIGDRAGQSVGEAGDIDGDGLTDILVGASRADPSGADSGRAYLVLGKADTDAVQLAEITLGNGGFAIDGGAAGDHAGNSLDGAGDVNGDGVADLLIGAPYADAGGPNSGRSYVVFGKADTDLVALADVAAGDGGFGIDGEGTGDRSGYSVSHVGDLDGDGLGDLVVGAPFASPNGEASGRVYVVFGKADTDAVDLVAVASGTGGFAIEGESGYDNAGVSVHGAGDVDGDGLADLVVGAPYSDAGNGDAGRVYVVFGKADTDAVLLADVAVGTGGFAIDGAVSFDYAGFPVSGAGDIDGDGLADLLVGAFRADYAGADAGRSYVVFGKADGDPVLLADLATGTGGFAIDGEADGDNAGRSVSGVGDVNGDGRDDLLVGAPGADAPGIDTGRCYLVFGKDDTDPVALGDIATGLGGFVIDGETGDAAGEAVSAAGDVNGDGFADLVVGSYRADPNGESSGRAYVIFGVPTAPE